MNIRTFLNTIITGLSNIGITTAAAHNVLRLYINDTNVAETNTGTAVATNNLAQATINFNSNGVGTRSLAIVVTAQLVIDTPSATTVTSNINTLLGASRSFLRVSEF